MLVVKSPLIYLVRMVEHINCQAAKSQANIVSKHGILLKKTDFVSWINSSKNMYYLDELRARIVDLIFRGNSGD